jgi:hypothetical protein
MRSINIPTIILRGMQQTEPPGKSIPGGQESFAILTYYRVRKSWKAMASSSIIDMMTF